MPSKTKLNTIGRQGKFRLAAACADLMSDDDVAWWLREVMAGRDPDAPEIEPGQIAGPAMTSLPTWTDRIKAAKMFLERRNGLPTQQVVIEQEVASQAGQTGAALARAVVTALPTEERSVMRALLAKAAGRAPLMIDTIATEQNEK